MHIMPGYPDKYRYLHQLCLEKNLPFASYRLPFSNTSTTIFQKKPEFQVVNYINDIIHKKGFVIAPFKQNVDSPIVIIQPDYVVDSISVSEEILRLVEYFKPNNNVRPNHGDLYVSSKTEYIGQVEKIKTRISEGAISKAILSRIELADKSNGFSTTELFESLLIEYPEAFVYLVNLPGIGLWIGASPEIFVNIKDNVLNTVAIAGTQKANGDINNAVWNKKEIEEQAIVSKYIENLLQQYKVSISSKEGPSTYKAGKVLHLKTSYKLSIEDINNIGKFIAELHPTPAVCGMPKDSSFKVIEEVEKHEREYYSGFLGPVNINDMTALYVNLRCMKVLEDKLALYVGGGITADSVSEKEWEETMLKANTILEVIEKLKNLAT